MAEPRANGAPRPWGARRGGRVEPNEATTRAGPRGEVANGEGGRVGLWRRRAPRRGGTRRRDSQRERGGRAWGAPGAGAGDPRVPSAVSARPGEKPPPPPGEGPPPPRPSARSHRLPGTRRGAEPGLVPRRGPGNGPARYARAGGNRPYLAVVGNAGAGGGADGRGDSWRGPRSDALLCATLAAQSATSRRAPGGPARADPVRRGVRASWRARRCAGSGRWWPVQC